MTHICSEKQKTWELPFMKTTLACFPHFVSFPVSHMSTLSPHISFRLHFNSSVTWNAGCKHECLHTDWDAAAVSISDRLFAVDSISSLCKKGPLAIAMSQGVKPSWMEAARPRSSPHTEGRGANERWYRLICWKRTIFGSVACDCHIAPVMSRFRTVHKGFAGLSWCPVTRLLLFYSWNSIRVTPVSKTSLANRVYNWLNG